MSKAAEITGLNCEAAAAVWATEVWRARFDEICELREAALNFSDIEGVHDMRVATRRLRSAIRDFEPVTEKQLNRKFQKNLKKIADRLGAVRDLDVEIEALEKLRKKAGRENLKTGLASLIEKRRRRRERARADLTKNISPEKIESLRAEFTAALERLLPAAKAPAKSFSEAGREAAAAGLADLYAHGAALYHPFEDRPLHKMRIAAKRLRYTLELFTACWGAAITSYAEQIAELQSYLGEVHDCDERIKNLVKKLKKADKNNGTGDDPDFQTAAWLLSKFVKKRTKNYRAALKLWSRWQQDDFAGKMKWVISS